MDCLDLLWVRRDSFVWKHKSEGFQWVLIELTLLTYSGRHLKTSGTPLAGLCHDFANMMTSSLMFITPWMSQICSLMVFWNISPNWYQNSIWCTFSGLLNVVMYLLSGARDDWWYPERRSSFKNTVAVLRVHVHQVIDCRTPGVVLDSLPCLPFSYRHKLEHLRYSWELWPGEISME